MQILKDTTALAIILLLALTVRIDTGRPPIDLDLTTPVEAAESGTPESEAVRPAAIQAEILRLADDRSSRPEGMEPRRLLVIEQHIESVPQALRTLSRLSHSRNWTIEIGPEAAAAPAPDAEPAACEASLDPGLSC